MSERTHDKDGESKRIQEAVRKVHARYPEAIALVLSSGVQITAVIAKADSNGDGTARLRAWEAAAEALSAVPSLAPKDVLDYAIANFAKMPPKHWHTGTEIVEILEEMKDDFPASLSPLAAPRFTEEELYVAMRWSSVSHPEQGGEHAARTLAKAVERIANANPQEPLSHIEPKKEG